MFLSDSLNSGDRPSVRIADATVYSCVDGAYADRPDPSSLWLSLESGRGVISLRMALAQLESIYQQLAALLTDRAVCSTTPEQLGAISESKLNPPEPQ